MIACLDVGYRDAGATAACVLFHEWSDAEPLLELVRRVPDAAPYEPGSFFRRELPCLLAVLRGLTRLPDTVVIDGYVWLGESRPGLGAHLHGALGGRSAVIGVAKTPFRGAPAQEVTRGHSRSPLYVTAIGMTASEAAARIRCMHGPFRIPTLLKRADLLSRGRDLPEGTPIV
ncbi:MAG: endonuclease V [Acidobacteriia bacterium]|nr:endonuclease V [Terriglobia bacterium]